MRFLAGRVVDLGEAGQPGTNEPPLAPGVDVGLDEVFLVSPGGPRSDDTHVAPKDRPQLRDLVEVCSSNESPDLRDAISFRTRIRIFPFNLHTPELEHREGLPELRGPFLAVQHRTGTVELDRHGNDRQQRRSQQQAGRSERDVEDAFDEPILPVPGFDVDIDDVFDGIAVDEDVVGLLAVDLRVDAVFVTGAQHAEELLAVGLVEREDGRVDVVLDQNGLQAGEPAETFQVQRRRASIVELPRPVSRGDGFPQLLLDGVGCRRGDVPDDGDVDRGQNAIDLLGIVADDDRPPGLAVGSVADRHQPDREDDDQQPERDQQGRPGEPRGVIEITDRRQRESRHGDAALGPEHRVENPARSGFVQRRQQCGDDERRQGPTEDEGLAGQDHRAQPLDDGNRRHDEGLDRVRVRDQEGRDCRDGHSQRAHEPIPCPGDHSLGYSGRVL